MFAWARVQSSIDSAHFDLEGEEDNEIQLLRNGYLVWWAGRGEDLTTSFICLGVFRITTGVNNHNPYGISTKVESFETRPQLKWSKQRLKRYNSVQYLSIHLSYGNLYKGWMTAMGRTFHRHKTTKRCSNSIGGEGEATQKQPGARSTLKVCRTSWTQRFHDPWPRCRRAS